MNNNYKKYPRTYHVPWSSGISSDDKIIESMNCFINKRVIVSEKMDGENFTLYNDHIHARSIDSKNHESRNWIKNFWSQIKHDIPIGYRICGENLYAKHSIEYTNLKSYFYGFSVWNENNISLNWKETVEWFKLLNITPVPILYDGIYGEELIKQICETKLNSNNSEGYVIRLYDEIPYDEFNLKVAKFVRNNHVTTNKHWMFDKIEMNKLK